MAFPYTDMPMAVGAAFGVDPTTDPDGWVFTDLSSRLLDVPMVKRYGRGSGAKQADAKTCTIVLDNDDGALTPLNAMSTYFPDIVLDVPFRITINPTGTPVEWFEGLAASYQPDVIATTEGTTAVIRITLAGIPRRLSQGAKPLRSALTGAMVGDTDGDFRAIAHWSCEDEAGATRLASSLTGQPAATFTGTVDLAAYSGYAGSKPLPQIGVGQITAQMPAYTQTGIWQIQHAFRIPSTFSGDVDLIAIQMVPGNTVREIRLAYIHAGPSLRLTAYDATGAVMDQDSSSTTWQFDTDYLASWTDNVQGGDHLIRFGLWGQDGVQQDSITSVPDGPGAGTTGMPQLFVARANAASVGWVFGQLALYTDDVLVSPSVGPNAQAAGGYVGEMAHDRAARLCREARVPITVTGDTSPTMGPQTAGTLVENLQECETTGVAVLADPGFGLSFVCLAERYNLAPQLTIDLATYAITKGGGRQVFTPIFDDQRYRNQWTVDRPGGSSYVASSATTTVYEDSDTVNVESDDQLPDQAWWRTNRDSVLAHRFQSTPIDLAANPALIEDWLALAALPLGLGQVLRTNPPAQHPSDDIAEMVDGWSETLSRRSWAVAIVGQPAAPYTVAELDSAATAKLDTAGSELHAAVSDSATTFEVATTSGPLWSADNAQDGFDWYVDGERVTVTDIAPSLVTFGAVGTAAHASNASVSPGLPGSPAAGDLMVMAAAIRNSGAGVPQAPSGWTRWDVFEAASNVQVFARIATSSESAPTVTFTGGVANADTSAQIIRLGGKWHDASFAMLAHASALNASAQNIAYPGLSLPDADNCIVLYLGWKQDDLTSVATIAGATEIAEASTTTGDDQSLVWDYVIQTTAAYIPPGAFTVTGGATAISRGAVVAIRCDYQTATVTRSVNGVAKDQDAGTDVRLWTPWRWAL